ncbi:hypothetical protein DSD19_04740 [Rhodovulum sp. BSW8]|uniref:hypothetical protein n=1 Tax=Rhodovulum sp. BSW8 TaxID=2259645 RepID=UPI000DE44D41|nr:hypothetical protein [Rhodovulum sp. BSW8]RBO54687.1 hypothetical protein DSD19_04740 [Rhodovulum sp. BSW8]
MPDSLVDRLRGKYAMGPHLPNGKPEFGWRQFEAPTIQHEAAAEIERLRDILMGIEIMTATGAGLDPKETIDIHLLAAEGRSDDPHAWRADPAAIARLRVVLRQAGE